MTEVPEEMLPDRTVTIGRQIDGFRVVEAEPLACLNCGKDSKWRPKIAYQEVRICDDCGWFAYRDFVGGEP